MKIRLIDDVLKIFGSLRYRGLWPALVLSILVHGFFLYGLGEESSRGNPSETRVVHKVLLIRLPAKLSLVSPLGVVEATERGLPDLLKTPVEQSGLLDQKEVSARKSLSEESPKDALDHQQLHGSPKPDGRQSEIRCSSVNIEDIPYAGQSNRLGRRIEVEPCEEI